jgi:hypothetical protein
MSTTYTGVPGNVTASAAPTTTIPQDAVDSLNAASVNVALQKLTDYVAQIESQAGAGCLLFGGTNSNVASTTTFMLVGGGSAAATAAGQTFALGSALALASTVVVRGFSFVTTVATVGGTITFTVMDNGVATAIALPAGAGSTGAIFSGIVSISSLHLISVRIANGVGVSNGGGALSGCIFFTLA